MILSDDIENIDTQAEIASETESIQETTETVEAEIKTFSEAELKKLLQSERSKAKGEILKELGISNVKNFKEEYSSKLEILTAERNSTLEEFSSLKKELENIKQDNFYRDHNITDDIKEDFQLLFNSKIAKEPEADRSEVAKSIMNKYFTKPNKIGVEKSEKKDDSGSFSVDPAILAKAGFRR